MSSFRGGHREKKHPVCRLRRTGVSALCSLLDPAYEVRSAGMSSMSCPEVQTRQPQTGRGCGGRDKGVVAIC